MENIIKPIDKSLLLNELTPDRFLRYTNKGDNELYCFTANDSPNLMREVGRLRELTFREAGGGTGFRMDIDSHDTCTHPYTQMIVWNPRTCEIIGGIRFFICQQRNCVKPTCDCLSTSHYFKFSENFKKNYIPYSIEIGRAFVQPKYQSLRQDSSSLYSLDNIWNGIWLVIAQNPHLQYIFAKITTYRDFDTTARNLLFSFLYTYFPDKKHLVEPIYQIDRFVENNMHQCFTGKDFNEDRKILVQRLKALNETIPSLFNAYMGLSPSLRILGTSVNSGFGDVDETAILLTLNDIYPHKMDRHKILVNTN